MERYNFVLEIVENYDACVPEMLMKTAENISRVSTEPAI